MEYSIYIRESVGFFWEGYIGRVTSVFFNISHLFFQDDINRVIRSERFGEKSLGRGEHYVQGFVRRDE